MLSVYCCFHPLRERTCLYFLQDKRLTGSALEIWLAPKASSQETQHHGEGNGQNWVRKRLWVSGVLKPLNFPLYSTISFFGHPLFLFHNALREANTFTSCKKGGAVARDRAEGALLVVVSSKQEGSV